MKGIFNKINFMFNFTLDLDFERGKHKTRKILELLEYKNVNLLFKKYLAQAMAYEPTSHNLKNALYFPVLLIFLPTIFLLSFLNRQPASGKFHSLYLTTGYPLLVKYSKRHAKLYGVNSYKLVNQYRSGVKVDSHLLFYLGKLLWANAYMLFYPYFLFFLITKLSTYNTLLKLYEPSRVYSYNERSFVGPFITHFLNYRGVKHDLIMHGTRSYNVKDALCYYDRMFVFGEYFKDLFQRMNCRASEYVIMGHPSLDKALPPNGGEDKIGNKILFVLQKPSVINWSEINQFIETVAPYDSKVSIVVKPKKLDGNWLREYAPELKEEVGRSNLEVLQDYQIFAGKHSTFLMEAWAVGKKVICVGHNSLDKEMIKGPNVLRLSFGSTDKKNNRDQLMAFINKPACVDWDWINYVFAKHGESMTNKR